MSAPSAPAARFFRNPFPACALATLLLAGSLFSQGQAQAPEPAQAPAPANVPAEATAAWPSGPVPSENIDSARDTLPPVQARQADPGAYEEPPPPPRVRRRPHFKSDIWLPLPSVLLPGFGQYFQGDWTGAVYTGVAVGGFLLLASGAADLSEEGFGPDGDSDPDINSEDWGGRKVLLGALAMQGSGFLSAYSAFRLSVPRFQAENGRYLFLTGRESVPDLLASPFRFGHLAKASTFVPLGILAGAVGYLVYDERASHRGARWAFSGDDLGFYGPMAYNAGLSEEALFRGWLLPMAYQYTGQTWWLANGLQAALFGLAHYGPENRYPWPQALLGYYFGYLTRKNGWTLSEAIFVHSWWDAILFAGQAATTRWVDAGQARFRIQLPLPL